MTGLSHAEQRARDALAFEPLPNSRWVKVEAAGIAIQTRYSEPLSQLLRSLPGARWDAGDREWRYPFAAAEAIRSAMPDIERLAQTAKEAIERETAVREREKRSTRERLREEARARKAASGWPDRPTPLRREYLVPAAARPMHSIKIEARGDDTDQRMRDQIFGLGEGWRPSHAVAQVVGASWREGRWITCYLPSRKDYSRANSVGSRGVYAYYEVAEGPVYLVCRSRSRDGDLVRYVDGEPLLLTGADVLGMLDR